MNKKSQLDYPIITFVIIVFGLLLLAPVMLKVFLSIQSPLASSLGNVSGGGGVIAKNNFNAVMTTAVNFWDKVIIAAFAFAILLLFVSAFFIDAHPFFIILYVFISFMVILFAPSIIESLDAIYTSANFSTEVGMLSFMDTLRIHFAEFLVGIMVMTGIIIYGKYAFFSSQGGGR